MIVEHTYRTSDSVPNGYYWVRGPRTGHSWIIIDIVDNHTQDSRGDYLDLSDENYADAVGPLAPPNL